MALYTHCISRIPNLLFLAVGPVYRERYRMRQ